MAELGTMARQRLPFAYLQLSPAHTQAGAVQVSGDLEALQRRGERAWEKGPAFLDSSMGLQPWDHVTLPQ